MWLSHSKHTYLEVRVEGLAKLRGNREATQAAQAVLEDPIYGRRSWQRALGRPPPPPLAATCPRTDTEHVSAPQGPCCEFQSTAQLHADLRCMKARRYWRSYVEHAECQRVVCLAGQQ